VVSYNYIYIDIMRALQMWFHIYVRMLTLTVLHFVNKG